MCHNVAAMKSNGQVVNLFIFNFATIFIQPSFQPFSSLADITKITTRAKNKKNAVLVLNMNRIQILVGIYNSCIASHCCFYNHYFDFAKVSKLSSPISTSHLNFYETLYRLKILYNLVNVLSSVPFIFEALKLLFNFLLTVFITFFYLPFNFYLFCQHFILFLLFYFVVYSFLFFLTSFNFK